MLAVTFVPLFFSYFHSMFLLDAKPTNLEGRVSQLCHIVHLCFQIEKHKNDTSVSKEIWTEKSRFQPCRNLLTQYFADILFFQLFDVLVEGDMGRKFLPKPIPQNLLCKITAMAVLEEAIPTKPNISISSHVNVSYVVIEDHLNQL